MDMVEKQWKTVNKKKKKKKENENPLLQRPWDALPSLALLNIIRNLNFKDRYVSFPFVCKAWNFVISNDPRCWSSMVPESISPDDAFIKKPVYSFHVDLPYKLFYRENHWVVRDVNWDDPSICPGVSHFRNLIKKSSSSGSLGSSTITSLYLDPFHFAFPNNESRDQDQILHLIAHCCPNLKHICFDKFYRASIEAVLQVFHKCNKIELIDFSDSWYANSVQVIEELGNCLPNLRGLRMGAQCRTYYSIHDVFAKHLPRIKLLAVECNDDEDFGKLTSETECCLYELQYLSLGLPYYDIIHRDHLPVCNHIPEFHYEGHRFDYEMYCDDCEPVRLHDNRRGRRLQCYCCYLRKQAEEEEAEILEYLHLEKYNSILEPKKENEYHYYFSILKEKKKNTRRNHRYVVSRAIMGKNKKEVSFISKMKMRRKRDKYGYQDFYVQTAF